MTALGLDTTVGLQPWVRLRHDPVRDRWVLLAPERVLFPCPTSVEVLQRLGPGRPLAEVVDELAAAFEAPREVIARDVLVVLQGLADDGHLAVGETA
jgi:coenzyme PQQ biosynthesis protein PqqD